MTLNNQINSAGPDNTASIAAILAALGEGIFHFGPVGNPLVQQDVDSAVRYSIYLINQGGDVLTDGETVPGTFTVHRVRGGVDTEIIAATAATESNGVISAVIDFTTGVDWVEGDLGYIEFTGITATPTGQNTTELPVLRKSFRVTQETDIESKIDTLDTKIDTVDAVADAIKLVTDLLPDSGALLDLALIKAVTDVIPDSGAMTDLAAIKAVTDLLPDSGALSSLATAVALAIVDGNVDDIETLVLAITPAGPTDADMDAAHALLATAVALAVVDGLHNVPAKDSADDINMRDVLGKKDDDAVGVVGTIASIVAMVKGLLNAGVLATGTFTTDSPTVPADTGRTEEDGFWDGSFIIPLTGVVEDQPRQIASFANTGGVFTMDSDKPFTSTPGLVAYVIVGSGSNLVVAVDSAANQTIAHSIGNKDDTVAGNSVIALLKQILALDTGPSSETTGPFSYLDAGAEQTVHSNSSTLRRKVSLWVSNQNMTQDGDFRVFVKLDGATFALFIEKRVLAAAGEEKVHIEEFIVNQDFEIRYEEVADETAARSIPFEVIEEPLE